MGMKLGVVVGLAAGYVLGTRAGREQYERIRSGASRLRRIPVVARPLDAAGERVSEIVRAQGEKVTDKVADAVKERLFGAPPSPRVVDGEAREGARPAEQGANGSTGQAGAPHREAPRR